MSNTRILIIDDDEVVLATTQAVLQGSGYDVDTHTGPFGASSKIIKFKPALVLLDVNMPGLSGPMLADLIRSKAWAEEARIFFFSSSDEEYLQSLVEKSGADGFVRKGDHTELRKCVAEALG